MPGVVRVLYSSWFVGVATSQEGGERGASTAQGAPTAANPKSGCQAFKLGGVVDLFLRVFQKYRVY